MTCFRPPCRQVHRKTHTQAMSIVVDGVMCGCQSTLPANTHDTSLRHLITLPSFTLLLLTSPVSHVVCPTAFTQHAFHPCRIVKLVRAMRKGWLKTNEQQAEARRAKEGATVYLIWADDNQVSQRYFLNTRALFWLFAHDKDEVMQEAEIRVRPGLVCASDSWWQACVRELSAVFYKHPAGSHTQLCSLTTGIGLTSLRRCCPLHVCLSEDSQWSVPSLDIFSDAA